MITRLSAAIKLLNAGEDYGDMVHLTAFRQPGTAAHGKLGSVIAFQKAGMSMAMLLFYVEPVDGKQFAFGDKPMFLVAPLQWLKPNLTSYSHWPAMAPEEAEALIRNWLEGDERHAMLGTTSQCAAWDKALEKY